MKYSYYGKQYSFPDTMTDDDALELMEQDRQSVTTPPQQETPESAREAELMAPPSVTPDTFKPQVAPPSTTEQPTEAKSLGNQAILADKVNPVGYGLRKAAEGVLNIANVPVKALELPGKAIAKGVEMATGNDALTKLANQPNGIEMLRDAIKVKPEEEFALSTQGLNDMEIAGVTQMVAELPEYIGAGMPINKAVASVAAKFSPKVLNAVASVKPMLQGAIRDFLTGFSVQEAKGIGSGETPLEAAPEAVKSGFTLSVGGAGAGVGGAAARKLTPELGRLGQVGGEAAGGGGAMGTIAATEGAPPDQIASQFILGAGFQGVMGALSKIGKKDFNRALKESAKEQGFALDETFDTPAFIRRKGEALNIYSKLSNETKAELSKLLTQESTNAEGIPGTTRTVGDQIQQGPEATRPATAEVPPATEGAVAAQPATPQPESGMLAYGQKLPEMPESKVNLQKIINDGLTPEDAGARPYDIKKSILNSVDQNLPYFEERGRGVRTWEEAEAAADRLALTPLDVLKRQKGQTYNQEELLRARKMEVAAHDNVLDIKNELYSKPQDQVNDADRARLLESILKANAISAEVFGAKREVARSLNILKKAAAIGGTVDYKKLLDAFSVETGMVNKEWTKDLVDRFIALSPDNMALINNAKNNITKPPIGGLAQYIWTNMLVSGPMTHAKNILGSIIGMPVAVARSATAATTEALKHPINASKREAYFREIPEMVRAGLAAFPEAAKMFALSIKNGESPYADATKLEGHTQYFSKDVRRFMPTSWLGAEDAFMQTFLRNMRAYQLGMRKATRDFTERKITREQIGDKAVEYAKAPDEKMMQNIDSFIKYNTFAGKPGPLAEKIGKIRQPIQLKDGRKVINPFAIIIPFHNAPANIMKYGIEHSPLGFITKGISIGFKQIPKEEVSEELAKPIIGSMIFGSGVAAALSGMISGGGPVNFDDKKKWLQSNRPYTIKVGDKEWSYAGLEPMATILGTAADWVEGWKTGVINGDNADEIAWRILSAFGRNFVGKSYSQWAPDLMDMINPSESPDRINRVMRKWATPVPIAVSSFARSVDPYYRYAPTVKDQATAKLPYLSQYLYPRRDIWGEPIKRDGNFWQRFVLPTSPLIIKDDPTAKEVWDTRAKIGLPDDKFSITEETANKLGIKGRSIQFTPIEFDLYTKNMGEYSKEAIRSAIATSKYKKSDIHDKADMIEQEHRAATGVIGKAMRDLALERRKENKEQEPLTQQQLDARILGYVLSKESFTLDQMKQWVSRMKSLTSEQKQAAIGDAVKMYSKRKAEGAIKAAMPNEPRIDNPFLPGGD